MIIPTELAKIFTLTRKIGIFDKNMVIWNNKEGVEEVPVLDEDYSTGEYTRILVKTTHRSLNDPSIN